MIGVARWVLGQLRRGVGRGAQVAQQRHERALGHEHRGRVDGVLARRAVVHRRVGELPQAFDDGPAGLPISADCGADRREVEVLDRRGVDDRPGVLDHARARLRVRECDLEVQQRLQPRAARDPLGDAAAGEHAGEDVRA